MKEECDCATASEQSRWSEKYTNQSQQSESVINMNCETVSCEHFHHSANNQYGKHESELSEREFRADINDKWSEI